MFNPATAFTSAELKSAIVPNPLVVTPDTSLLDAIGQMSGVRTICPASKFTDSQLEDVYIEARSSCTIVMEGDRLLGILTERDVVRLIAEKQDLAKLTVRDVMTHPTIVLHESEFTDLFSTINLLQHHHIRHLPILDELERPIGLLTHESLRQVSRPVDLLRLRLVGEVMTPKVICANPDVSMQEIAHLMASHRISCVAIVQTQVSTQPQALQIAIGIVTERDIVQFQALNLDLEACQVQSVMSTPIFAVRPTDSLWVVQQTMEQRRIRRLVVTGAQGELLGIVTQSSLLQVLNPLELYKLAEVLEQKVLGLEAEKIELLENRTTELEQQVQERTATLKTKAEQERLIATISAQIRSSLDLQDILNTTSTRVLAILGCDRVAIWQILPDRTLLAVAESTSGKTSPLLGQTVSDPCFETSWTDAYRQGRVRLVSDIYTTEMADCHRALLEKLQTRAKVLIPIIHGDVLWGLLEAVESDAPRQWQPDEVTLLQQLATQLAIAIQQATAYQQSQTELLERRQTEASLRSSEQRYATLAAAAPVGIFRTDAEHNCLYVNEKWCRITGFTPETAAGIGWKQGLHPDDLDPIATEWDESVRENHPFRLEYRFQRPDGTMIWVFGQSVAERDADGKIVGYVGTVTDISDRKQAEQALQQLNQNLEMMVEQRTDELRQSYAQLSMMNAELTRATQLKDEFLANMSHELRTPLNAILGLSEALKEEILGSLSERQQKAIGTIEKSGRHLLELINDILDLSKISSGKMELNLSPIAVHKLCDSSLLFVRQQAFQKGVRVISDISTHLGDIIVDERRIRQVLINLLTNAVKFTPAGGEISLQVAVGCGNTWHGNATISDYFKSQDLPLLLFQVSDTGIGIAPNDLPRLFQPFVQIDSSLNRQQTGTGLGLAMVKQVAELHGGQVTVESCPGQGSHFTVALPNRLPISAVSLSPAALPNSALVVGLRSATVAPLATTISSPLILLAEDNEANIQTFTTYLTARNYRVIMASNGSEAVAMAKSQQPDIILMDIQMPGMDGLEATRLIRADERLADIPIVALTALAMPGDRERCLEAGANQYLSKPVGLRQLVDVIRQFIAS